MSERFKVLYKLEQNLYDKNSPIIISAGTLLKDTKTDSVITQLKFQSITDRKIIAFWRCKNELYYLLMFTVPFMSSCSSWT